MSRSKRPWLNLFNWALEEAALLYHVESTPFGDHNTEHFRTNHFGQALRLIDGDVSIFESGAILLDEGQSGGRRARALNRFGPGGPRNDGRRLRDVDFRQGLVNVTPLGIHRLDQRDFPGARAALICFSRAMASSIRL